MLSDILRIGDRIHFPDPRTIYGELMDELQGKKGAITGFAEQAVGYDAYGTPPGIYQSHEFVSVQLDGERNGEETMMIDWMELADPEEARRRETEWQTQVARWGKRPGPIFLRELPLQPLWPGDRVKIDAQTAASQLWEVDGGDPEGVIQYVSLHGPVHPHCGIYHEGIAPWYRVSRIYCARGGGVHCHGSKLALLSRGCFWQYYHNEPMRFEGLFHEALVNDELGLATVVPNDRHERGVWTPEQLTEAIGRGYLDGCRQGIALHDGYYGLRFKNRGLAARLRAAFPKEYNPFWMQLDRPSEQPSKV